MKGYRWLLVVLGLTAVAGGFRASDRVWAEDPPAASETVDHGDVGHGSGAQAAGGYAAALADPTHANATDRLTAIEEIKADLAIYTFIVFLLVMLILWKFAWKPIGTALDNREKSIAHQIDEAHRNAEESRKRLAEYETKLAHAADEVREMLAQGRRDADAVKERIVHEAQQAAARERERAVADIHAATNAALGEIAQKSADMAFSLAGRIVRRELKPEDHSQLVREAIEQMPSRN